MKQKKKLSLTAVLLLIAFVLRRFWDLRPVRYAFFGIRAGVLALIAKALITMYRKCPKGAVSYIVMFGAFAAAAFLKVPVVLIIICCAVFGIVASAIGRRRTEI